MKSKEWKEKRLIAKRSRKYYKRSGIENPYIDYSQTPFAKEYKSRVAQDKKRIENLKFELDIFLNEKGNFFTGHLESHIEMSPIFCLQKNYDNVLVKFGEIRAVLLSKQFDRILLDFSKTTEVSFEVLFLLKVILDEYLQYLKKQQRKLAEIKLLPSVRIRRSQNPEVLNMLIANQILTRAKVDEDQELIPMQITQFIKGSKKQKHYHENRKGLAGSKIRDLINQALKSHDYKLNEMGANNLDGIISEVLNNAEDHSEFDSWYTYGNLFETTYLKGNENFVGQINLAFLNFGYSIFEGFELTKNENQDLYGQMQDLSSIILTKNNKDFDKQSLFTLYALQDGYSRLKGDEESRGTGTMKFINSFLNLGDYEDDEKKYVPQLLIYSGKTLLKCDNNFKPYKVDDGYYLSLNSTKSLLDVPSNSHLRVNRLNFPGTFLVVKIYLNKNQLSKKVNNGNKND